MCKGKEEGLSGNIDVQATFLIFLSFTKEEGTSTSDPPPTSLTN